MKAIIQRGYGSLDTLTLQDVSAPLARADEVLVRVRAASVHPDVWHVVAGRPFVLRLMGAGLCTPKQPIPGTDVAGVVEAVGAGVTRFKVGDDVFGETIRGMQWVNGGAYAELVAAPAHALALKPRNVTFEQAAAVPSSGIIALAGLRDHGRVRAGHRVLINGAAGGVGALAVQIAKALGAHVTAVDRTDTLDMLRALGADAVVDYTRARFIDGPERYDLVLDIPGNHSFAECRRVLAPGGVYVLIGHDHYGHEGRALLGSVPRMLALVARTPFAKGQLPAASFALPDQAAHLETLRALLEAGSLTPLIDRAFPLAEAREALRRLASGQARGKIVLVPT